MAWTDVDLSNPEDRKWLQAQSGLSESAKTVLLEPGEAHKQTALHATVFLPLTFITGLLGMNVAGIPDSHNPWGFWLVVGGLAALGVVSWVFLRLRE